MSINPEDGSRRPWDYLLGFKEPHFLIVSVGRCIYIYIYILLNIGRRNKRIVVGYTRFIIIIIIIIINYAKCLLRNL